MHNNRKTQIGSREFELKGKKIIMYKDECIGEIIDTFVCCQLEEWDLLQCCGRNRIVFKGNVYIKIHYVSKCNCNPIRTKKCILPFCEVIEVTHNHYALGIVACCVMHHNIALFNPYGINYRICIQLIWRECLCGC